MMETIDFDAYFQVRDKDVNEVEIFNLILRDTVKGLA